MPPAPADLLQITGLTNRFRGGGAIGDVSFSMPVGAITAAFLFALDLITPGLKDAFWHLGQSLPESQAA